MNSSDTSVKPQSQCGCASHTCHKTSSAESLLASIQNGNIVCNLGTSTGFNIKAVSEKAGSTGKVIVIAAVPSMLSSAQKEIASSGITNTELRLGDADSLPIESNTIDIITGENSLATNQNRDTVLKEFNRVLRTHGKLVLSEIAGFCVASCITNKHEFESIKTMLSDDLNKCLRHNGFSIDFIDISIDKHINDPDISAAALIAVIRASKV